MLLLVVDLSQGAALLTRGDAVQAHVELLAVFGVSVLGVVGGTAVGVQLGLLGAGETVLQGCGMHTFVN